MKNRASAARLIVSSKAAKTTVDASIDEDFCGRMTEKISPQMAYVDESVFP